MKPQPAAAYVAQKPVMEQPVSVGEYAHLAIKKSVHHILRQEKGVLAHGDPEYLHQMRVGLRRLRSVCQTFDSVVVLPVCDRDLKRLGKTLGQTRDLDILHSWLETFEHQTKLKKSEIKVLRRLHHTLDQQRQQSVAQTDNLLTGSFYKRIFKAIKKWLKHPHYQTLASLPLNVALPDLQLPSVSQLLLHPGWLVVDDTDTAQLIQMHALRKQIKGVRYQMSLFKEFYGKDYQAQVDSFRQMQDVLGELQDEVVLQEFLVNALGKKWAKKLPSLKRYFHQHHKQLWQQWLTLRKPYLSREQRDSLHRLLLA